MSEEEITIVKVQRRPAGSFMATISMEVVRTFDIKEGEKIRVLIERQRKRIVYEPMRKG